MAEMLKSTVSIQTISTHNQRRSHRCLINQRTNPSRFLIDLSKSSLVARADRLRIMPKWVSSLIESRRTKSVDSVKKLVEFEDEDDNDEEEEVLVQPTKRVVGIDFHDRSKVPPWGICGEEIQRGRNSTGVEGEGTSSSVSSEMPTWVLENTKIQYLEERDEEMLSKRMVGLCKSNRVRSALELYVAMEVAGVEPSPHACNSLIACLLRNGSLDNALKVFDKMKERGRTTCHTYSLLLKEIARIRGCNSAREMFMDWEGEEMVRRSFDAVVYNTMMSICGEANKWVETERLWTSLNENGHRATIVTYRLLISIFARCGQPELAFKAYSEMVKSGMIPTENMAQAVIGACTKEGKWELALSVYESMLSFELKPNEVIYNALINSLGKAGELRLAFKLFDCMRSSGHTTNAYTWNALIVALNREKRYADALRLFESVEKEQSSLLVNSYLFNSVLVSCQRLGSWDRSLQLLWKMEVTGLSISTASYNLAIGACEAARKPRIALQVYERMIHKNCIPDTFTYMSLIRACIWGSLWSEVVELLDHVPGDACLYNIVVQGMCLQGKMVMAKKLYLRMRESGIKADGKTRALMLQNLTKH